LLWYVVINRVTGTIVQLVPLVVLVVDRSVGVAMVLGGRV
jgi:hypothetical protein